MSLAADQRGSTYPEFLIAFMPLLTLFLSTWQLSDMFTSGLSVQHAAIVGARTAGVVLADDPAEEGGDAVGELGPHRRKMIEDATMMSLASQITDGTIVGVEVEIAKDGASGALSFAPQGTGAVEFVSVDVRVRYRCHIPLGAELVCGADRVREFSRHARYPYQGAAYDY